MATCSSPSVSRGFSPLDPTSSFADGGDIRSARHAVGYGIFACFGAHMVFSLLQSRDRLGDEGALSVGSGWAINSNRTHRVGDLRVRHKVAIGPPPTKPPPAQIRTGVITATDPISEDLGWNRICG